MNREPARTVSHEPVWTRADLVVDQFGKTVRGYVCVHVLENGGGVCGGNVLDIDDATGLHLCVVRD